MQRVLALFALISFVVGSVLALYVASALQYISSELFVGFAIIILSIAAALLLLNSKFEPASKKEMVFVLLYLVPMWVLIAQFMV